MDPKYSDPDPSPETLECKEDKELGTNVFEKGLDDHSVKRWPTDIGLVIEEDNVELLLAPEKGIQELPNS